MYNYFGFVSSAASIGTGWLFLSQQRSHFLELLCMCCKAFTDVHVDDLYQLLVIDTIMAVTKYSNLPSYQKSPKLRSF